MWDLRARQRGAGPRRPPRRPPARGRRGMLLPNGQALTPDGRTLIVAESAGQRLTAFTISPDGSHCGGKRTFGPGGCTRSRARWRLSL